ncbi:MAG TPA: hypothetical protein VGW34_00165 [Allosphingosinicella sp.]|nr:hypothetical protein [Allosphingosinicella sp.]
MDSFRGFDDNAEADAGREDEPSIEPPPEIGADERRMHVRAYNYWVSLLDGRAYPSISDLEPQNLDDFGPYSVLLNFSVDADNPQIAFIGRKLREETGLTGDIHTIADVPSRSLLSRLTDHYLQIIANCAPIGFEAEFVGHSGNHTMYRGILMPLSSDGDTIDFIYGVINWKEVADHDTAAGLAREVSRAAAAPAIETGPVWADGPNAEPLEESFAAAGASLDLGGGANDDQPTLDLRLGPDAALADRLCAARECAEAAQGADVRSRAALYRALGQAYDFAVAAEGEPDDYAEILEDAGLKAQARAPMTPVVKLIFGVGYDKSRLTEFAAALSYGRREAVPQGEFAAWIESFGGGLKGVVAAERAARRPAQAPDRSAANRAALRIAPALATIAIDSEGGEFVLLVARREPDGRLAVVAPVAPDQALLDRAIRKTAA